MPNLLSFSRIFLTLAVLCTYSNTSAKYFILSTVIITVALITDMLDGIIARAYNATSHFGYIIDGLGDRALHVALYLIFFTEERLGLILLWFLVFREIALYALRILITDWIALKNVRKLSLWSGWIIRLWLVVNIALDGIQIFYDKNYFIEPYKYYITAIIITGSLISYVALLKYLEIIFKSGTK